MKIAIIINTSWNIYNFRKGLVRHFLDQGYEVMAIAPPDSYTAELENWGCQFIPIKMQNTGMNPVRDFGLMVSIFKILRHQQPDAVLTYTIKPNIYGSIVSGILGIPCICNVSGLGTVFLWRGALKKFAVMLYSFAFRFNKWVFFQNEEDKKDLLSWTKINPAKTSVLPGSGINTEEFGQKKLVPGEKPVFLMVSRLIVEKGVRDFAEAARLVKAERPKVVFRLVGGLDEGHARTITQAELAQWLADDIIEYQEHIDDVRIEMQKAEVVVLPSYREGTPRTLLEAGATGRALLASDVPGCRQVVNDGINGFLFDVKSPKDFAAKVKLYLSLTKKERMEMALNSRKWIEQNYDEKIVIDAYQNKLNGLLSSKN